MAKSSASPARQVALIPELLELILLKLASTAPGLRTLLQCQRINRNFRRVILGSLSIQRALFFKPVPEARLRAVVNPLLQAAFNPIFSDANLENRNEALYDVSTLFDLRGRESQSRFLDRNASWRRMLIVQPSLRMYTKYPDTGPTELRLQDGESLTMGLLFDILKCWILADPGRNEFRVLWKRPFRENTDDNHDGRSTTAELFVPLHRNPTRRRR